MKYVPELDGLRAICVLFTVLNHIGPHPAVLNGTVGVDVFFALSGFLITTLLIRDSRTPEGVSLRAFYIRRFFRIVPLYYGVFALYVAAAVVLHSTGLQDDPYQQMTRSWAYVLGFMSEYRPDSAATFFGHAWTLGIEEKYYLAWPVLFLALQPLAHSKRLLVLFALWVAQIAFFPDQELRGYGGLTVGSALAMIVAQPHSRMAAAIIRTPAWIYALALGGTYVITLFTHDAKAHLLLATAAGLLIASMVSRDSQIARALRWKPLVFSGQHTYAIYLIHVLVANAVVFGLGAAKLAPGWFAIFALTWLLSLAAATVLKRAVEDPLIALGRSLAARRTASSRALKATGTA